jgi:cytosine/adenosine deaminase-related metal-dependent hydrolase
VFFNAHAHLELSFLRGAIPSGIGFVEWLQRLVALKRAADPEAVRGGIRQAFREMADAHTAALLDIDSMGAVPPMLDEAPFPVLSITEMIAFHPAQATETVQRALDRQAAHPLAPRHAWGLSPHAPYTTTAPLLLSAHAEAACRRQWLCIHTAETPEETQMMERGSGPLRDFLSDVGALPPDWEPPRLRPIPYLATQGILGPNTLLIHCNDIDERDLAILAQTKCHVVVCPGTHVYFGRGAFPLERLLAAGIPTHLGTDSFASNESLDMAREVNLACELTPKVDPHVIAGLAEMTEDRQELFFPAHSSEEGGSDAALDA